MHAQPKDSLLFDALRRLRGEYRRETANPVANENAREEPSLPPVIAEPPILASDPSEHETHPPSRPVAGPSGAESKPPVVLKPALESEGEESIAFFYTLGICLNRWAYVDRQLYFIGRLIHKLEPAQMSFLFYRIPTFAERLAFVDDSLRTVLRKEEYEKEWLPTRNKIRALMPSRRLFGHLPAKRVSATGDARPSNIHQIPIERHVRSLLRDDLRGKQEIGIEDLQAHAHAVEAADQALISFTRVLNRLLGSS